MNIWYNIKNFFGLYKSNTRTLKVIQNDGVEYTYEVDKSQVNNELKNLEGQVKLVKIL